ncbi:hypothetical protein DN752_21080 [Echinicola strongylocentroti]|uniref:Uncharacterized protein n=1 Tax=Echinicola strongylocentroti TaxID=1795355 RepID=A0A2Z4INS7_9BACT|nr:hypothetical protein [Echinicola strongylocentroti]AWW32437.1 hypothetical protein DN752_21080 [Echinicola strongylocentroti]
MDEINNWFKGDQEYQGGVDLYRKYGKDPVMLSLFNLPETSFTRGKLVDALKGLSPQATNEENEKDQSESKAKLPKQVLELIQKRSVLHGESFHLKSKTDRHKVANAILAISSKLDSYFDHGELPEEATGGHSESDLPNNGWELHMLINTNAAYIAKNKTKDNKQGEVKRRERQNTSIEERLKSINYETTG